MRRNNANNEYSSLKNAVQAIILTEINGFNIKDARYYVEHDAICSEGGVSALLYTEDTEAFAKNNYDEIIECYDDIFGEKLEAIPLNDTAWLGFEMMKDEVFEELIDSLEIENYKENFEELSSFEIDDEDIVLNVKNEKSIQAVISFSPKRKEDFKEHLLQSIEEEVKFENDKNSKIEILNNKIKKIEGADLEIDKGKELFEEIRGDFEKQINKGIKR